MATAKPGSVIERLLDKATDVTEEANERPRDKLVIHLAGDQADQLDSLAAAAAVLKVAGAEQEEAKKTVKAFLRDHYLERCILEGEAIANPTAKTEVASASFQVRHVGSVAAAFGPAGDPLTVADRLRAAEFTEEVVQEIVAAVVVETPGLRVKSLTELAAADCKASKKLAEKIGLMIEKGTTRAEKALMLQKTVAVSVDARWKAFAVALAIRLAGGKRKQGVEILGKLFEVLPVDYALAQITYGGDVAEAFGKLMAAGRE